MDDTMMSHERQGQEHLRSEPPNEGSREAHKAIGLDQLVQVETQKLHCNAEMATEVEVFDHLRNMVLPIGILEGRSAR